MQVTKNKNGAISMSGYYQNQQLITERDVAISIHQMNGVEINDTVVYKKGEVLEIVEVLDDNKYKIAFWIDDNKEVAGKPITHEFNGEEIQSWLLPESEDVEV